MNLSFNLAEMTLNITILIQLLTLVHSQGSNQVKSTSYSSLFAGVVSRVSPLVKVGQLKAIAELGIDSMTCYWSVSTSIPLPRRPQRTRGSP